MSMATGTMQTSPEDLRKTVSLGREPEFTDGPSNDKLFEMVLALSAEVSVLRDRLDTHERLAQSNMLPTPEAVEAFDASADVMAARSQQRQSLLTKVFRPIRQAAVRALLEHENIRTTTYKHPAEKEA